MIIFLDTSGQIISDDSSEQIGRNSSNAAQIYIVTKMSPTTKFFFSFRLPNGTNRYGGFAENSEYSASLIAENVEGYNVFLYPVRDNITEYAGTVLYTVYGVTESMRTSGTSSFSVNPAVRIDIGTEPTPNVWEDILALISRVENDKLDKVGAGDSKRAYTVNADGTQGVTPLTETPTASEIPTYKDGGALAVNLGGSGDAVPLSYVDKIERRVENLEEAANGSILTYSDKVGIGSVINVPERSLKYAALNRLGAHTTLGAPTVVPEVSSWTLVEGSYAGATFENGVLTIDAGSDGVVPIGSYATIANNTYGNPRPLLKGLYSLNVNEGYPIDYTVRASVNGVTILNKTFSPTEKKKRFVLTEDTDDFTLTATSAGTIVYYQQDLNNAIVKEGSFETVVPRSVKVIGKNLFPDAAKNIDNWNQDGSWWEYKLDLPDGWYCITVRVNPDGGYPFYYLQKSANGEPYSTDNSAWSGTGYVVPGYLSPPNDQVNNKQSVWFKVDSKNAVKYRLACYNATQEKIDKVFEQQIEAVEMLQDPSPSYRPDQKAKPTAYTPYVEYTKTVPPQVLMFMLNNCRGISASVCDYIDLDARTVVQTVGARAYEEGDEDNNALLTDGEITLYPLASENFVEDDFSEYFEEGSIEDFLAVQGKGWIFFTDEDIAYDMTFQAKKEERT